MGYQKKLADFHIHSLYSFDAVLSPEEIVDAANHNNASWIAITDHNNLEGVCSLWDKSGTKYNIPIAEYKSVNVVSGVEVTCRVSAVNNYNHRSCKVHLLVYGASLDKNSPLVSLMETKHNNDRDVDFGLLEYMLSLKPNHKITEKHIRKFIQEKRKERPGYSTMSNADIYEFLNKHGITVAKSYKQFMELVKDAPKFDRINIEAQDLIDIAHASGGIVIMAHPAHNLRRTAEPEELIRELIAAGIDGFETSYVGVSDKTNDMIARVVEEEEKTGSMIYTGGSDTHSLINGNKIGLFDKQEITTRSQRTFIKEMENLRLARMAGKLSHRTYENELSKQGIEDILEMYELLAACALVEDEKPKVKTKLQVMPKLTRKKIKKQQKREKKLKAKIKKERRSQRDEERLLDIETNLDDAYASYLEYMKLKYGKSSNLTDDVFTEEDFLDKSE